MITETTSTKKYTGKQHTKVLTELENTLEGFISKMEETQAWISKLEDKAMEITQTKQQSRKWILKSEGILRDLWDNIKWNNIHIIKFPEEKPERARKISWRKNAWKYPYSRKGNRYPHQGSHKGSK